MDNPWGKGTQEITQAEHVSPEKTGDNIEAKRVANYNWSNITGKWQRAGVGVVAGADYDFIDAQQTSSSIDTFVYKLGGSGGTTVRTIVVTYTDSTKTNIDTVAYS